MMNEALAYEIISVLSEIRKVDEAEKEDITKKVISSTGEQLEGWQSILEIAKESKTSKILSETVSKLASLKLSKISFQKTGNNNFRIVSDNLTDPEVNLEKDLKKIFEEGD